MKYVWGSGLRQEDEQRAADAQARKEGKRRERDVAYVQESSGQNDDPSSKRMEKLQMMVGQRDCGNRGTYVIAPSALPTNTGASGMALSASTRIPASLKSD